MINDSVYYGEVSGTYYPVPGQTQFSFKIAEDAPEIGRYEWNAVCFYLTISRRGTDAVNVDTFKGGFETEQAKTVPYYDPKDFRWGFDSRSRGKK